MAANRGVACRSTIVLRTKRCLSESSVGATATTVGRSIARAGLRRRWPSSTAHWQKRRNAERALLRVRGARFVVARKFIYPRTAVSVTRTRWNGVPPGCVASQATKLRIVVRYVATVLGSRAPNDAANSCKGGESSPLMVIDLLLTLGANDSPTRILRQISSFDCFEKRR